MLGLKKTEIINKIDSYMRYVFFVLIILLPFSKSGVEICFVLSLVLWLTKHLIMGTLRPEPSALNEPLAVFVFVGILSVIGSFYLGDSLRAFFSKFIKGILLYFFVIETIKRKRCFVVIVTALLFVAAILSIYAITQYFCTGIDLFSRGKMDIAKMGISASLNHPNSLAGYLLFPLMISVSLVMNKLCAVKSKTDFIKGMPGIIALSLLCLLFGFAMVLTNSRGAWLGLVAGTAVLFSLTSRRIFKVFLVFVCLFSILFFMQSHENIKHRFRLSPPNIKRTIIDRTMIWRDSLCMIKDRPVFGHGVNTYMKILQGYRRNHYQNHTYAHNCYLQMAAEMGLIGLACFLWIIIILYRICVIKIKILGSESDFLLAGLLCGLLAFLTQSFVDTNMYSLQLRILMWFMIGLAVAVQKNLSPVKQNKWAYK